LLTNQVLFGHALNDAPFVQEGQQAHRAGVDVLALSAIMSHPDIIDSWKRPIARPLREWNSHRAHLNARAAWESDRIQQNNKEGPNAELIHQSPRKIIKRSKDNLNDSDNENDETDDSDSDDDSGTNSILLYLAVYVFAYSLSLFSNIDPAYFVRRKVTKVFIDEDTGEEDVFNGVVVATHVMDGKRWFFVKYDDGDEEHIEENELRLIVV
jgi:hypothetical protein